MPDTEPDRLQKCSFSGSFLIFETPPFLAHVLKRNGSGRRLKSGCNFRRVHCVSKPVDNPTGRTNVQNTCRYQLQGMPSE